MSAMNFNDWWNKYYSDGREDLTEWEQDVARAAWDAAQTVGFNAGLQQAAVACERCMVYSTAGAYYAQLLRDLIKP
jgi:mRNA-degrading endonuclease HigB of HigAB toxin-antitoxin module